MKAISKLSAVCLIIFLIIQACSNGATDSDSTKDQNDSIQAARAADSMLKDVVESDTTSKDKVAVDSSKTVK
ncbi:MAG: hypothetical protein JWN56_2161 [Sphingobacteriales bacterium]|nr:hypothetical protein [Sphingobacteriales bacterium]